MRVLRALFGRVDVRLFGRELFAVLRLYEFERVVLRFLGNTDGVRSYISNQRDMVAADVHTLVEVLRHKHCFGRGHAELVRSVLLQRRGSERRGSVLFGNALGNLRNFERGISDRLFDLVGKLLAYAFAAFFVLIGRLERLVFFLRVL